MLPENGKARPSRTAATYPLELRLTGFPVKPPGEPRDRESKKPLAVPPWLCEAFNHQ
jgi:hypothetical protein